MKLSSKVIAVAIGFLIGITPVWVAGRNGRRQPSPVAGEILITRPPSMPGVAGGDVRSVAPVTGLPARLVPATDEQVRGQMEQIRALRQELGMRNLAIINLLVAGVAAREPQQVLDVLDEPESERLRRSCIPTLLNVWIATDPVGALATVRGLEPPARREEYEFKLLGAMAEQDPERALEILERSGARVAVNLQYNTTSLYHETFLSLGMRVPSAALAMVSRVKDSKNRETAFNGVVVACARADFRDAVERFSAADLEKAERSRVVSMIYSAGFYAFGEDAMAKVGEMLSSGDRKEGLSRFGANAERIIELDPKGALAMLSGLPAEDPAVERSMSNFLGQLASQKPREAVALIGKALEEEKRIHGEDGPRVAVLERACASAMERLKPPAEIDDPAEVERLRARLREVDRSEALRIASRLAKNDPAAMATIMLENCKVGGDSFHFQSLISDWMDKDREQASEWFRSADVPVSLRERIQGMIENSAAGKDPVAYAEVVAAADDNRYHRELAGTVAIGLCFRSVADAGRWATTIRDPELFKVAANYISEEWLAQDRLAAEKWIEDLPASPGRDQAVRNLIGVLRKADPEAAKKWQATLESP